jgi:hypothetical protein
MNTNNNCIPVLQTAVQSLPSINWSSCHRRPVPDSSKKTSRCLGRTRGRINESRKLFAYKIQNEVYVSRALKTNRKTAIYGVLITRTLGGKDVFV